MHPPAALLFRVVLIGAIAASAWVRWTHAGPILPGTHALVQPVGSSANGESVLGVVTQASQRQMQWIGSDEFLRAPAAHRPTGRASIDTLHKPAARTAAVPLPPALWSGLSTCAGVAILVAIANHRRHERSSSIDPMRRRRVR
jgi:hypothetical protein